MPGLPDLSASTLPPALRAAINDMCAVCCAALRCVLCCAALRLCSERGGRAAGGRGPGQHKGRPEWL